MSGSAASWTAALAWAEGLGAHWHAALEIRDGPRGRGVFATAPIEPGETLLRCPAELVFKPTGKLAELCASGECSRTLALALMVLHELHVASPRKPYFELLAATPPPDLPLLWEEADLERLSGSSLLPPGVTAAAVSDAAAAAFDEDVRPMVDVLGPAFLPPSVCTHRNLAVALSWVVSRSLRGRVSYELGALWPYLRADGPPGDSELIMLPLFDMLNHSVDVGRTTCTTLRAVVACDATAMEMVAERPLASGEEAVHCYGRKQSAEMLRSYGFIEDLHEQTAPHESLAIPVAELLACALAAGTARPRQRLAALEAAGLLPPVFVLDASLAQEGLPAALLTAAQVLCMRGAEYREWQAAGAIALGVSFLDEDSVDRVVALVASLAEVRLSRLRAAAELPPTPAGVEVGDGRVELARALRRAEEPLLRALQAAAVALLSQVAEEEGEEEEDGEEDGKEVEAEAEEAPPGAKRKRG